MVIEGKKSQYELLKSRPVADFAGYRLYLCKQLSTERVCLLQIASDNSHNSALDRAAFHLQDIEAYAHELQEKYERDRPDAKVPLGYELGFPEFIEGFNVAEQGNRRVNVLAFRSVEDVRDMVPLHNIIHIDRLRVDVKTSVWIAGKALKLLAFLHSYGFSGALLDEKGILIQPDKRYVVLFDLFNMTRAGDWTPGYLARGEIAQIARSVLSLLGFDPSKGFCLEEELDGCETYLRYLHELSLEIHEDASRAHARFYEIVEKYWGRKFHPFTTLSR